MDATAQFALMAKAKKVFGHSNTFLSFPLTPLPFTKQQLSFSTTQSLQDLEAFSLLVNLTPTGEAWQPTEAIYLWDFYQGILRNEAEIELAQSIRSSEEEAQYQQAFRFLFTIEKDGFQEETDALKTYKQYRDQWFVLNEKYKAAKLTGEASTDPTLKQQWETIDEPALRNDISNLEAQWTTQGFKQQVETAQAIQARLGAKSPDQTWAQWKSTFNPDLDGLTSTTNMMYYPSGFFPSNALETWQTFTLTRDEIKAFIQEIPKELRDRISSSSTELESLTFEFSTATINRPWFNSGVFNARFWRFSDIKKVLSDGGEPPYGLCPAYVTAVVFVRKVLSTKKAPIIRLSKPAESLPTIGRPAPILINRNVLNQLASSVKPVPIRTNRELEQPLRRGSDQRGAESQTRVLAVSRSLSRLEAGRLRPPSQQGQPPPPENRSPSPVNSPPEEDNIYILAFICKKLPQCPNPDLTLSWSVPRSAPQLPARDFRVIEAILLAEPAEYTGQCPTVIHFSGRITVAGGSGTVTYQFIRSDGTAEALQSLTFAQPGSQDISTTWSIGSTGVVFSGWIAIQMNAPNEMTSNQAHFSLRCQ